MKKIPHPVTIDFETHAIQGRPYYPPVPVGVSIKSWGRRAKYYAWGHTTGNNCTKETALEALKVAYANPDGVLCQNGKFDHDVCEVHFGVPRPQWQDMHESMFLLFLDDPHQPQLDLKSSAERLLGLPPEEKDEVVDWLVENQPVEGVKISRSKQSDTYAMKYVPYCPGDIVGRYANGDTTRTEALFKLLYPKTVERGMLEAYDRERKLMPILLEMERRGLPVDLPRLRTDVVLYRGWYAKVDAWLLKQLGGGDLNLDSGEQLMAAMIAAGKVDESKIIRTPKSGKPATNKEALLFAVTDKSLLAVLKYRAQLKTCLGTFLENWLRVAEQGGGLIFTTWNQVRSPAGDSNVGARTGRLSSTPPFMNLPKEFTPIFAHEEPDRAKAKLLPKCPIKGLPTLPQVRSYVIPFEGEVLIDRDYSQQEPRILAHFDGGELMQTYIANPWIDFHDSARDALAAAGKNYPRKVVKNTNLGLIYGMGVGKLAAKNDMSVNEAKALKDAILSLYPGLKDMYKDMKARSRSGVPFRTWGEREVHCEADKIINGKLVTFDYKMANGLIQGSAADCTKEAIIRFHAAKSPLTRILLNVHDQITASTPKRSVPTEMQVLRVAMESVEFDVPMLSEGSTSSTNWNDLKDYDKKGKKL